MSKKYTGSKILLTAGASLLGVSVLATYICNNNVNAINTFLGTTNVTTVQSESSEETDTEYYKSSYEVSEEGFWEMIEDTDELIQKEVEEGAVLIKNENNALPLSAGDKVTTYGIGSVDPVYTSSGSVSDSACGREIDFIQGLKDAGLVVNETAVSAYETYYASGNYGNTRNGMGTDGPMIETVGEVPWSVVNNDVTNVSEYGDAAFFSITRYAGEGNKDLNHNGTTDTYNGDSLTLSTDELGVLAGLKAKKDAGEISKIIVIINATATVDLAFLDDEAYGIDACISVLAPGTTGFEGLGNLLVGNVNPSGKANDVYWYNNSANPVLANQSSYEWANIDDFDLQTASSGSGGYESHYLVYQEGIYLGYRYTETRYEDYVTGRANTGDYDYSTTVSVPFGYGLSYTTFSYSDYNVSYDDDEDVYTVSVRVTNTGDYAGKEAVQVYLSKPYDTYNIENGVEASSVELVGYGKTDTLAANGGSELVTITIDGKYLASYDADNAETYVLTPGDYYFVLGNGAHEATNNLLAAKGYTPSSTNNRMDAEGDATLAQKVLGQTAVDTETYSVSSQTGAEITNLFEDSDLNKYTNSTDTVEYMTRNDWAGTVQLEDYSAENEYEYVNDNHVVVNMTNGMLSDFRAGWDGSMLTEDDVEYPTYGVDSGLNLIDLRVDENGDDIPYDSDAWDRLLDQLTWDETVSLLSEGMRMTASVDTISKPQTLDHNGCLGVTQAFANSSDSLATEVGIDSSVMPSRFAAGGILASSMNHELAYEVGQMYGENGLWAGYSGLYGPGVNLHRSQYSGRNSEYFSEDAYLSGMAAADLINGLQEKGVYAYIKHFVLNDQEVNRYGLSVWLNEQSFRELYLRAFQIVIEESNPHAMMTAYSRIGTRVAAVKSNLMTDWLRGEEGFDGFTVTDMYISSTYGTLTFYIGLVKMPAAILCGNDLVDGSISGEGQFDAYKEGYGELAWAMRESAHRILYTVVHSAAMNGYDSNTTISYVLTWWQTTLIVTDVVFGVATAAGLVFFSLEYYKRNLKKKKA